MAKSVIKKARDNRLNIYSGTGAVGTDILDIVKNMPDGFSFYATSNNPINQPQGCSWGSYLFMHGGRSTTICYIDDGHLAFAKVLQNSESINWHIL